MEELKIRYLEYVDSTFIDGVDDKRIAFKTHIEVDKTYTEKLEIIRQILNAYFKQKEKGQEYTFKMFLNCFDYYGVEIKIDDFITKAEYLNIVINNKENFETELGLLESENSYFLNIKLICMKKANVLCEENGIPKGEIILRSFKVNDSNKFQAYIKVKKSRELENKKAYFILKRIFESTKENHTSFCYLKKQMKEYYNYEFKFSKIYKKDEEAYNKLIRYTDEFEIKPTLIDSYSEAKLILEFVCDKRRGYWWL
ncbi:hypothetical protein [Clostridium beijerinckii]|uniref:hypothetical protein n=1 Tax=Clostridium beijerinckii TaxID=1520 RepID=UPI0022E3958E|nr:hypothetical protein [Clostridium beijerinckii]